MDLIRALLLKLEALELPRNAAMVFNAADPEVAIEGWTDDQIGYHFDLLLDDGLILGDQGRFVRLTSAGHDFVESVRDPEIWRKTKDGALKAGGFSLELLSDLARGFLKKRIGDLTGINL